MATKRGWCDTHYACWRTTGNPVPQKRPHHGQNIPRITPGGYRLVYDPRHPLAASHGYVYEHRKVAWDNGILVDPSHHVHHRNHDKLDNRLSNLEAKPASQHAVDHIDEDGYVVNQYGVCAVFRGTDCTVDGCTKPATDRGWCSAHSTRFVRSGDPLGSASKFDPVAKAASGRCIILYCRTDRTDDWLCDRHRERWDDAGRPMTDGHPDPRTFAV